MIHTDSNFGIEPIIFSNELTDNQVVESIRLLGSANGTPIERAKAFNLFAKLVLHPKQLAAHKENLEKAGFPVRQLEAAAHFFEQNGGVEGIKEQWGKSECSLELFYHTHVLRYWLHDSLFGVPDELLMANRASELRTLLHDTKGLEPHKEYPAQEITEIFEYLRRCKDGEWQEPFRLTKDRVLYFLHLLRALSVFKPECRHLISVAPVMPKKLLTSMAKALKDMQLLPQSKLKIVIEETELCSEATFEQLRHKIGVFHRHYRANIVQELREEQKFTSQEWDAVRDFSLVGAAPWNVYGEPGKQLAQTFTALQTLTKRNGEEMIRVKALHTHLEFELEKKAAKTIWKWIFAALVVILADLFDYTYAHACFLVYSKEDKDFYTYGKKIGEGIYRHGGNSEHDMREFSKEWEEFDIDIGVLIPQQLSDEQKREFQNFFTARLRELVTVQNRPVTMPNSVLYRLKYLLPNFKIVNPADLALSRPVAREIGCGEFVAEAIIEAHRVACARFDSEPPARLSAYGFKDTQLLSRLSPNRCVESLVRRGILKRTYVPVNFTR